MEDLEPQHLHLFPLLKTKFEGFEFEKKNHMSLLMFKAQFFSHFPSQSHFKVCLWNKARGLGQGLTRPEGSPRVGSIWSSAQGSGSTLTQTEGFNPIICLFFFHL